MKLSKQEMKELAALEKGEGASKLDDKYLKPGERLDDLQIKGYEIIQSPGRFCFGMDAVLLSAFAKVKRENAFLILEQEREFSRFFWLQRQKESIYRAGDPGRERRYGAPERPAQPA